MHTPPREPVSRRNRPARPALSRTAIVTAALEIAEKDGLAAVSMRRVATELDTGASALYVYVRSRDDLLEAAFDHLFRDVARTGPPPGSWRERLTWLLLESVTAASGHGGLAQVALTQVPARPNAVAVTNRVSALLTEAGLSATAIPAALDLLGLFVTAAALDRVPAAAGRPAEHRDRLRWEIEVVLNGLTSTPPPPPPPPDPRPEPPPGAGSDRRDDRAG